MFYMNEIHNFYRWNNKDKIPNKRIKKCLLFTFHRSSIPKSMQPKTTLLKKAMQDAETSVSSRRLHLRGSESQGSSRQSSRSAIPQSAANRSLLLKAMEQAEESVLKRQGNNVCVISHFIRIFCSSKPRVTQLCYVRSTNRLLNK